MAKRYFVFPFWELIGLVPTRRFHAHDIGNLVSHLVEVAKLPSPDRCREFFLYD